MGTTLTSLNADAGIEMAFVVAIEGYPNLLCSGSSSAALTAWAGTDYTACLGGLSVHWDQRAKLDPWKPFSDPAMLSFSVVPATDSSGNLVDTFGVAVAKRTPASETRLVTAIDCNDTSITTLRANDFAASGDVYMGPETIAYSARDTGTDVFTVSTRGKYSPCTTSGGARFSRTHKPIPLSTTTGDPLGVRTQPVVASSPTTWVGRWVEVWIHRVKGGVLDVKAEAHRAFVGTIADVGEGDHGETTVSLEGVQRRIYETVLHRDPWRATIQEGFALYVGQSFDAANYRQISGGGVTSGDANALVVVSGAPASANEIQAGVYTCTEMGERINRWLASEKAAGRLLFNCRYTAIAPDVAGSRATFTYDDTTGGTLLRFVAFRFPNVVTGVFMGWEGGGFEMTNTATSASLTSPRVPLRVYMGHADPDGTLRALNVTNAHGTWITQQSLLPAALRDPGLILDGVAKVGEGYVRVAYNYPTAGQISISSFGMDAYLPGNPLERAQYTVDDDVSMEITQVLVFEATFKSLLLQVLLSTGTNLFNHGTYDALGEGAGCAIPYSILGDSFVTELTNLAGSDKSLCAVIDKPTRFIDLFEADFLIRSCFFYWGGGRLGIRGWSTPASSLATITLDETSKAVPASSADGDLQRATKTEDDGSVYNILVFKHTRRADGEFADEYAVQDATSIRDHGARVRTIEMRNTSGPASGQVATDVRSLLSDFSQVMPLFSRPFWRIKRTIARTYFEQALPGTVVSFTDKHLRDPVTGLRYSNQTSTGGVSNHPALVIGHDYDWGGPGADCGGEVELMLVPRTSHGSYAPAAQVDETQANAGYDAGNTQITVYAHEHSASSDAVDASRFAASDVVLLHEIDAATPAGALSWTRTVSSVTGNVIKFTAALAAPAWDNTLRYRLTYAGYSSCTASQQAKTFQADDADGLVADSRQPYEMAHTPGGQSAGYDLSVPTSLPARYANVQIGDGVALDVGGERDISRFVNNLPHYRCAKQTPQVYSETRPYTAGTWSLVEVQPIFIGAQAYQVWQNRKLYVAPMMRSTTGGTASVRVTLARYLPTGTSRSDVTRGQPYASATFTSTSTSFAVSTEQGVSTRHLAVSIDGWGYVYVEISSIAEYLGLAAKRMGPLE